MAPILREIADANMIEKVEDVSKAYPELDAIVEKMVKRGQWNPPGYYEK